MWVLPVQIRRLRRRSEVLPALLVMLEDGVCLSLVFLQVCLDVSVRKFSQIPSSFFSWVARDSSGRPLHFWPSSSVVFGWWWLGFWFVSQIWIACNLGLFFLALDPPVVFGGSAWRFSGG